MEQITYYFPTGYDKTVIRCSTIDLLRFFRPKKIKKFGDFRKHG